MVQLKGRRESEEAHLLHMEQWAIETSALEYCSVHAGKRFEYSTPCPDGSAPSNVHPVCFATARVCKRTSRFLDLYQRLCAGQRPSIAVQRRYWPFIRAAEVSLFNLSIDTEACACSPSWISSSSVAFSHLTTHQFLLDGLVGTTHQFLLDERDALLPRLLVVTHDTRVQPNACLCCKSNPAVCAVCAVCDVASLCCKNTHLHHPLLKVFTAHNPIYLPLAGAPSYHGCNAKLPRAAQGRAR